MNNGISIVIPVLNFPPTFPKVIKQINKQILLPKEIVIVNSGVYDGMERYVKKYKEDIPIIVELRDETTLDLIKNIIHTNIYPINMHKTVNRLIAQSIVNPGIGPIYSELLDFNGPSFYMEEVPQFVGEKFSNLLFTNDELCICGISNEEETIIIPNNDYKIKAHDKLIILCEGKEHFSDIFAAEGKSAKNFQLNNDLFKLEHNKQILIIGNHIYLDNLIKEIFEYYDSSSKITIITDTNVIIDNIENTEIINSTFGEYIKQPEIDINIFDNIIVFSNNENDDKFTNDSEVLVNYILIKN